MSRIYTKIIATGSALPPRRVTNAELATRMETSDEWIRTRSGIQARHWVDDNQTTSDLAAQAARIAIERAQIPLAQIDLIVVATTTPDMIFPSTACIVQEKLGLKNAAAFDVQAVCSGFVYAMHIVDKLIASGAHKTALVIGAEVYSHILDWNDRTTCVLFGDGAGAVVVQAGESPGVLSSEIHADGSQRHILSVPGSVRNGAVFGSPFVYMDGKSVFKFAVEKMAQTCSSTLERANAQAEAIDWLIPHQANIRIMDATAKKLGLPSARVISTVQDHGNTSAASIPLALDVGVNDGRIQGGQRLMLVGVGGGFTWGSVFLEF